MTKTLTVDAIILARKNYAEADRLVFAYAKEKGKITIRARGARKLKSKMAGHIEPFTEGKYSLAEGKSYYVLTGAEIIRQNQTLLDNLEVYKDASYLCELVEKTSVENQYHKEIYGLLSSSLIYFCKSDTLQRQIILRFFEYNILKIHGYGPSLFQCKSCGKKLEEQKKYSGNFEGIFCGNCGKSFGYNIDRDTIKILRLFDGNDLEKVLSISNIGKYNNKLSEVIWPFLYDIIPKNIMSKKL